MIQEFEHYIVLQGGVPGRSELHEAILINYSYSIYSRVALNCLCSFGCRTLKLRQTSPYFGFPGEMCYSKEPNLLNERERSQGIIS